MCSSDESLEQSTQVMPSLRGAPLLLVEDEAINQAVAREMLESIGLRVSPDAHHHNPNVSMHSQPN
ncbi:MAG: hypothetical protein ABW185_07385 [Sedimenticola sp.]